MAEEIIIRNIHNQEEKLIAQHSYKMWIDIGIPPQSFKSNYQQITQEFINQAKSNLCFQAFVAEVNDKIVGSISCQIYDGLYPDIIEDNYEKKGYIWGVYVESPYRNQGIGTKLTQKAIAYLQTINCNKIYLNAAPMGKPVYEKLGFIPGNLMYLPINPKK